MPQLQSANGVIFPLASPGATGLLFGVQHGHGAVFDQHISATSNKKNNTSVSSSRQAAPKMTSRQVGKENTELFRIKGIWPLDFFPNELIIREEAISVVARFLIYSDMVTIPIREVARTELIQSWFFASLKIYGRAPFHEVSIEKLWKNEARRAKRLIDHLVLEHQSQEIAPPVGLPDNTEREKAFQYASQFSVKGLLKRRFAAL